MRHLALLSLLWASAAFGQVTAPSIVKVNRPIVINHESGAKVEAIFARVVDGVVRWESLPDDHFARRDSETILAAPVGEYIITTGDSRIIKIVSEGGPDPQPRPDPPRPEPQPEPQPEPVPDKLRIEWAIWIEEQSDRSQHVDATQTMLDPELWSMINGMGAKIRVYDDDQTGAEPFARIAKDERPALILMESDERYLVFPAPTSREDAEALIRRHAVR